MGYIITVAMVMLLNEAFGIFYAALYLYETQHSYYNLI
jgi:hypothetical protein